MSNGRRAKKGQRELAGVNPLVGIVKGDMIWACPTFNPKSGAMKPCKVTRVLLGRLDISGSGFKRHYVLASERGYLWARTEAEARQVEALFTREQLESRVKNCELDIRSVELSLALEARRYAEAVERLRKAEAKHRSELAVAREVLAAFDQVEDDKPVHIGGFDKRLEDWEGWG